jgi:hypothetical protein
MVSTTLAKISQALLFIIATQRFLAPRFIRVSVRILRKMENAVSI